MNKYVITSAMKRHERSNLCIKLFDEMWNGKKMYHLAMPLGKIIDQKIKSQNKLKPSKEPVFTITSATHKGIPFYIFMDRKKKMEVVFNTSPVDASYVEFTRVINLPNSKTMMFTQHVLDRYNERVHGRKYDNYKDMLKRMLVNNPMENTQIIDKGHKIVMKMQEGFLSGSVDATHKILVMNTFFDKDEQEDNKMQRGARTYFDSLSALPPEIANKFRHLVGEQALGHITQEELITALNSEYDKLKAQAGMLDGIDADGV